MDDGIDHVQQLELAGLVPLPHELRLMALPRRGCGRCCVPPLVKSFVEVLLHPDVLRLCVGTHPSPTLVLPRSNL